MELVTQRVPRWRLLYSKPTVFKYPPELFFPSRHWRQGNVVTCAHRTVFQYFSLCKGHLQLHIRLVGENRRVCQGEKSDLVSHARRSHSHSNRRKDAARRRPVKGCWPDCLLLSWPCPAKPQPFQNAGHQFLSAFKLLLSRSLIFFFNPIWFW